MLKFKSCHVNQGPDATRGGCLAPRGPQIAGLVLLALLPSPAHAQDATVLAALLAPPIFLSPLVVALGRWAWLHRYGPSSPRFLLLFGLACLEVVLWGLAAGLLAVMFFDERWHLQAVGSVAVALLAGWGISRHLLRTAPASQPSWRETFVLASATPFGLAALGGLATMVLMLSGW